MNRRDFISRTSVLSVFPLFVFGKLLERKKYQIQANHTKAPIMATFIATKEVKVGDFLYITGGFSGRYYVSKCEKV